MQIKSMKMFVDWVKRHILPYWIFIMGLSSLYLTILKFLKMMT